MEKSWVRREKGDVKKGEGRFHEEREREREKR